MLGMLVVSYWFTVLFLNIVPVIGVVVASLAIPGLSVGLMQAARNLERGQPIGLQTLYGSLKENARTLIALGALYLFGGEVIASFTFAMLAGVLIGTFSSIYIAGPVLIAFKLRPENFQRDETEGEQVPAKAGA